jgi:hypothetical protein
LDHKRNEDILEDLKAEPLEEKLRRYKSNWLRHATRINSSRITEIMLNCGPNGRRRIGRPLKRILQEAETGLLRPKWLQMMMMMMMMMMMSSVYES